MRRSIVYFNTLSYASNAVDCALVAFRYLTILDQWIMEFPEFKIIENKYKFRNQT